MVAYIMLPFHFASKWGVYYQAISHSGNLVSFSDQIKILDQIKTERRKHATDHTKRHSRTAFCHSGRI